MRDATGGSERQPACGGVSAARGRAVFCFPTRPPPVFFTVVERICRGRL
ncbi:hypothetical protein M758_2G181700 [Ceratodon purpureus]|uniref:Uncharacterized protein n=1 Tax=Ceratodon purpureus TaxID=3225 RepID=A0A8T0IZU9_CERPU|nr:hypothetical protein KC19_2G229500 [Ceratodon purpureus]KAG0627202.1 hypothetical protein M758_2G181700 [Ceratodon purpureus]